ncbi:MAG: response regulator transcription factor [bacterium]
MNTRKKVVAIDNEESMLKLITYIMSKNGYEVVAFGDGEKALEYIIENKSDLVILDVMLPNMSGFEICKILKNNSETWKIPVIMLTARNNEYDVLTGFEQGADDYITKPFSEKIFLARVNAVISRTNRDTNLNQKVLNYGELLINPENFEVKINDNIIELTNSEFKVLHLLAQKPGRAYTRSQILDELKGDEAYVFERSIDVLMVRLRKKLGLHGKNIETIYGVGYKFKENAVI